MACFALSATTSSTSWSTPGTGSRGRRTARPSRRATRRVARSATVPWSRERATQWKNSAEITAAIGIPKIAPAMPAILPPMTTDARTTIGWMPTEPANSRGEMMFIVTNQAMPIRIRTGTTGPLGISSVTSTGGSHDTNGPKNGTIWSRPAETVVMAAYGSPNTALTTSVNAAKKRPMITWPRRNPPNDRPTLTWSTRIWGTYRRRHQAVDERQDVVPVQRDVDRQDHQQQDVAQDADARDRDGPQRLHEPRRELLEVGHDLGRLPDQVDGEPERGEAVLELGEERWSAGSRTGLPGR